MLAAFGGQGQAARGRDQQEAGVLVAGVDQRIEAAVDEGIVDGADRQQAGAGQMMLQAHGAEDEEQVLLGDAQLDMLAGRRHAPALGAGEFGVAEDVVAGVWRSNTPRRFTQGPRLVETVTSGLVVTMCLASSAHSPSPRPISARMSPKPFWVAYLRPLDFGPGSFSGTRHQGGVELAALGGELLGEGRAVDDGLERLGREVEPLGRVPLVVGPDPHLFAEAVHLVPGHHARVVVLMTGERQAHALDGVGDEAGGLVAHGHRPGGSSR